MIESQFGSPLAKRLAPKHSFKVLCITFCLRMCTKPDFQMIDSPWALTNRRDTKSCAASFSLCYFVLFLSYKSFAMTQTELIRVSCSYLSCSGEWIGRPIWLKLPHWALFTYRCFNVLNIIQYWQPRGYKYRSRIWLVFSDHCLYLLFKKKKKLNPVL